jgi:hypothetical protein
MMQNGTWGGYGYECDICGAEMNQHGQHYHSEDCYYHEDNVAKRRVEEENKNKA